MQIDLAGKPRLEVCIMNGKSLISICLALVMVFSFGACSGQKTETKEEEIKPVTVERGQEPAALQTANEATAIALRQYVYARIATEEFISIDPSVMSNEELVKRADDLLLLWENAKTFSSSAEDITNRAVALLEKSGGEQISKASDSQNGFLSLMMSLTFDNVAFAEGAGRKIDPQTWAENLTKQYDALRGANRYQQLAKQLGTDAKGAYEQMALAQKIIRNAAEMEEAQAMVDGWTKSINYLQGLKTASKVGLFVTGTVVTGGGSLSALSTSSMSLGEAGAVIVSGVDCVVDIAATGSNIIVGEGDHVAVKMNDVKDKLAPVSAVVGLATFDSAGVGEKLAYIGDTLVDWFYEGKVMGVKVDETKIVAQIFTNNGEEALKIALKAAGFMFPESAKTISEIADKYRQMTDAEAMTGRIGALATQIAELEQAAGITSEDEAKEEDAQSPEKAAPLSASEIAGTYRCIISSEDGKESADAKITIRDNGDGTITWIDEEGNKDVFHYDRNTNTINIESEGSIFHMEFAVSEGKIVGEGYTSGKIGNTPVKLMFFLTKISD